MTISELLQRPSWLTDAIMCQALQSCMVGGIEPEPPKFDQMDTPDRYVCDSIIHLHYYDHRASGRMVALVLIIECRLVMNVMLDWMNDVYGPVEYWAKTFDILPLNGQKHIKAKAILNNDIEWSLTITPDIERAFSKQLFTYINQ